MSIVGLVLTSLLLQDPQLPPFPQRSADTVFAKLGMCQADLDDTQKWAQMLVEEIKKRDAEIAALKAHQDQTSGQPTPDLPSEISPAVPSSGR